MDTFIPITILATIGLAGARLTQFLIFDSMTDPLRARLAIWHADKYESKVRTWIMTGLGCPLCLGWWATGAMLAAYITAVPGWHTDALLGYGVSWWAAAMIQCLANFALDKLSD